MVGRSPAPPTSAETTMSALTSRANATSPSGPARSSGRGGGRRRASWSRASASRSATARGEYFLHMSAILSTFDPLAASPATVDSHGGAASGGSDEAARRQEPGRERQRRGDGHDDLSDGAPEALSRAQDRREPVAADRGTDEIRGRFAGPRHPYQEQHELRAVGAALQPDRVAEEPADVDRPEHGVGGRLDQRAPRGPERRAADEP